MNSSKPLQITITPGTVVSTVLILLGFWLAWYLRDLLLVVLTAVVLASSIESTTRRMVRWGLPRVMAVALLYLVVVLGISALFYFFVPQLVSETRNLAEAFPTYLNKINVSPHDTLLGAGSGSLTDVLMQFQDMLKASSSGILAAATTIFGGLMSFALIVVLSFYFAVQDHGLDDFLRMVTPLKNQEYVLHLWTRAQHKMGRWLQGQLILSLIVGVLVYIGLLILGVPYALLLGIIAAFLELVPVFGSLLAAVPAVAVAFMDGGASLALLTIALYVVVNQLEGNLIAPLVVQKVLGISPLVVILAIIIGAQLGGFLGILIAVPVAAAVQEYVNDLQKGKRQARDEDENM
ncbi:MAG: AI-2E family transporter [Candidatus Pacebacteria bacterium]|nr:AI-2E family transporter [Candidatus Paceibacterota bacterium]